ncbi:MAG: TolC family protein, partial [Bacteroidales bacterium]|nr:TolC family protein [Bacteroidales bacterium]MDD3385810.1 TolC family protein [Bacteroidales bacterium]
MRYISKLKAVLLFMMLASALTAGGQESWSLDQCIQYAQDHNINLKKKQLSILATQDNLKVSRLDLLPTLNSGVTQSFRFGRSVDPLTYEFTTENS